MRELVTLSRDTQGVMIPSGEQVTLPAGSGGTIIQSLGGAYTVITDRGMMIRVAGQEVEALGKEPTVTPELTGDVSNEDLEKMVWDQLKTCYDPEIPVNIVDLGLVYLCDVQQDEDGKRVHVKMTLTAPGCGMGPVLANDVRGKVLALPGVKDANIEVVFDPTWDRSMMTDAAKLQLGMMW